jgi:uncharacterized membrane protein YczE
MKAFFQSMYQKENFIKRLIAVILAVITMGFSLSFLVLVNMGTDPCTSMNLAISAKIGWSLGNWQAFLNIILFILVISLGCNNIGFGTLANMFLVGYALDFFSWIWSMLLPSGLFTSMTVRIIVLIPSLLIFILAAAVYMNVDLGTAPYDAIPFIIFTRLKDRFPFRFVRMGFDISVVIIGCCFGAKIGIVTVLMAFLIGPTVTFVGNRIKLH